MRSALIGARTCAVFTCLLAAASGCRVPVDPLPIDPVPVPTSTGGPLPPAPVPSPTQGPSPGPSPTGFPAPVYESCVSDDPNRFCLGLKLVSLVNPKNGVPSIDGTDAGLLIGEVNKIWSQCNLAFQLEDYEAVDPTSIGLDYGSASEGETTQLRRAFSDSSTFLVVITGPWSGKTIAWTTEGGSAGPYGTIVDEQYGHNPMTVGHELGHYIGLYHIKNSGNLMNPYIGSDTSALSSSQCQIARQTTQDEWKPMFRH